MKTWRNRPAARRRGLSIVEVMISLTISAFLLVAVAAAYNASADAVEMNDRFFRATQAGRVTMNQLLTEIRRADSVEVSTDNRTLQIIRPGGVNGTRMENEVYREYKYDPATKKVTLRVYFDTKVSPIPYTPEYSLASNVEDALFGPPKREPMDNGALQVVRVPVSIRVKIKGNEVTLSGASGPRRAAKS